MSSNSDADIPNYRQPPVIEVVLGVQFDRLPGFRNAHLGAFWKTLDPNEWPSISDAPPLEPQFERFDKTANWVRGLQLKLTQDPTCRLQIRNAAGTRMVQVQNGRFCFNWLGETGEQYPRFEQVLEGFKSTLAGFVEFVDEGRIGKFKANQWEVTYVNHIPKGTVWSTPSDWRFFLPLAGIPSVPGVVRGESFGGEWHFVIPEQRGRLHVQWRHGVQGEDGEREVVVLTLTARGPLIDQMSVFDGIALGRGVVVRSFAQLMSQGANEYWGLKNEDT